MSSVKIIQRTDKTRRDGTAPLYIRLTHKSQVRFHALKVNVLPDHWDQDQQRVNRSHPFSQRMNARLAQKRAEFEELAFQIGEAGRGLGRRGIKTFLSGDGGESFLKFARRQVDKLKEQQRFSTARTYGNALSQLSDWLRGKCDVADLSFGQFTTAMARDFKHHLEKELRNHPNTVRTKFAALRRFFNLARQEGLVSREHDPLGFIHTPGKQARKVIPSPEEMAAIEALDLEAGGDLWHTRNLYLFAARMAGIRFSDVVTLRFENVRGDHLEWTTRKTGTHLRLFMPEPVREILGRYQGEQSVPDNFIFPPCRGSAGADKKSLERAIAKANSSCNVHLRKLCEMAGLSRRFSFHSSRHYFATQALRRGVRVEVLKEIMTHSSLKQTLQYVRIMDSDLDAAMRF